MILRPYQQEIARAVVQSVQHGLGLTFTVEIARQGGKNELSAHIEILLLTMFIARGGISIKASPTFRPQAIISMQRLKDRLNDFGFSGIWTTEMGYCIHLGSAKQLFLSAADDSAVVGHTADIILEIDEAQDVNKTKFNKEFRPMTSASNTTTVLYGTTWDDSTLLEQIKQENMELQKKDGIKRHFRYDWQEVARYNPSYLTFIEAERQRLGEDHPLFRTQYALLPLLNNGRLLTKQQVKNISGKHPRMLRPESENAIYVAGVDFAGEAETDEENMLTIGGRDATVVTIAELKYPESFNILSQPEINIVQHYYWVGIKHTALYQELVQILKEKWRCQKVVCDATGIGEPVTSFLKHKMGQRVVPFKFTKQNKSEAGFDFIAAVNSGRLKLYAGDGSYEYQELMLELERAKGIYSRNQTLNYFIEPDEGHDDFLISLVLTVQAADGVSPRKARGRLPDGKISELTRASSKTK